MNTITCGYDRYGVPYVAEPGADCRVDPIFSVWGVCPTSISNAGDCGFFGWCYDLYSCSEGCGDPDKNTLAPTISCTSSNAPHCSVLLSVDINVQSSLQWASVGCGPSAVEGYRVLRPNAPLTTTPRISFSSYLLSPISTGTVTLYTATSLQITTPPSSRATTNTIRSRSTTPSLLSSTTSQPASTIGPSTGDATHNNSSPVGPIVGGIIGGLVIICLTILGVVFIRRKRKGSSPPPDQDQSLPPTYDEEYYKEEPAAMAEMDGGYDAYRSPVLQSAEAAGSQIFEAQAENKPVELAGHDMKK